MNELKFGIIGYGSIAKKHIKLIKNKYPASFIYILAHKKKIYSNDRIIIYYNDRSFFKNKYDFVLICNPCTRHLEYLQKCINNNIKNIFVEKPLSDNFNQLKIFVRKNIRFKKNILVGYVLLFNRLLIKTLELLNQNKIGKLISANIVCNSNFKKWRKKTIFYKSVSASKYLGGGVLNELSHELSYAIELFGPIQSVFSKINYNNKKKIDVETEANIFCITKTNTNLGIFINFLSNKEDRYCEIIGTKGKLLVDFNNKSLFLNDKKIFSIIGKLDKMYEDQLNFFVNNNLNKKRTINKKFDNAYQTNNLIEKIKISDRANKIMRVT